MKRIALALFLFATTAALGADRHFIVLQLNDVYKIEGLENGNTGGLARVRTLRKELGKDGTPVLVMHAGDLLFPSVMSKYLNAEAMIRVLNMLDGDASKFDDAMYATIGNHELEKSDPLYALGRLAESDFRWVSSNVHYCHGGKCTQTFATRLKTVNNMIEVKVAGVSLGIFGLTTDSGSGDYFKVDFTDQNARFADVQAAIDQLQKDGAQLIVGLTHEDLDDDITLAQKFPQIAFIAGGHDHQYMEKTVGKTKIAKGDADARSVIVWDVVVPETGDPQITTKRVFLDTTIAKDPDVDAEVQRWLKALEGKLGPNAQIGSTKNLLEGVEPVVRGRESALGNFLADVAREWMHTDIGLMNGGGIRINDNIPPGPVRTYDMEGIFYYSNNVVSFPVTGSQLLDILNNGVSRADAGDGRFLQVSGIQLKYRVVDGKGAVTSVLINGKPLDPKATYTVGTIDYIYNFGAGDGFTLFDPSNPAKPKLLPQPADRTAFDYRKATEATIAALPDKTITTAIEGRITRE
ncbi:MAG TPA: bifunctional UDP-sugar hydrolase/5'-nucleotidase [Thermoanaerobaculia bacterium]|nr:bifunctional UDP-sugar hydrolase/5'-nucleotidase [Thermoanaerobaculia bacterium]